jgi:hypothetical protein
MPPSLNIAPIIASNTSPKIFGALNGSIYIEFIKKFFLKLYLIYIDESTKRLLPSFYFLFFAHSGFD